VHTFLKTRPYQQTYLNSNNREIIRRIFYGVQLLITVLLLKTLRFPENRTCETTDEVGYVLVSTLGKPKLTTQNTGYLASVLTCIYLLLYLV